MQYLHSVQRLAAIFIAYPTFYSLCVEGNGTDAKDGK
jgi:hypothetical protein